MINVKLMDFLTVLFCGDLQAQQWLNDPRLLGCIRFGDAGDSSVKSASGHPICQIPLPLLADATANEVWISARPADSGVNDDIYYAADGDVLFLHGHFHELAPDALHALTTAAYQRLFATAHHLGYRHFLRIWNYFPEINQDYACLERYRAFCIGRHEVLASTMTPETALPAGSALGTLATGLQLYALAARHPGIQIENPRQISAFHYPSQYGRRSPSFSRAIFKHWAPGCEQLYISGTASIVGHASQHQSISAQLNETLANLAALLTAANHHASTPLQMALLKIYVRPTLDTLPLRARIGEVFGHQVPMLFLQADICRQELLIEIEGIATSTNAPLPQDKRT
jgi:chorismate lyase/3-hydroxybenzoate synthase